MGTGKSHHWCMDPLTIYVGVGKAVSNKYLLNLILQKVAIVSGDLIVIGADSR